MYSPRSKPFSSAVKSCHVERIKEMDTNRKYPLILKNRTASFAMKVQPDNKHALPTGKL